MKNEEREKPLGDIIRAFAQYPHLPMLDDQSVVLTAVGHGVADGTFGVRVGDRVYFGAPVPEDVLDAETVLLRTEVAQLYRSREPATTEGYSSLGEGETAPISVSEPQGTWLGESQTTVQSAVWHYHLRAKVPWDKLSDFFRGVVLPLHDEATVEIEVSLTAHAAVTGIQRAMLDHKVRETLAQIRADILEERQA